MASPESIIVLPTEILENIFAIFTDFLDLKSLRETCRTFEPLAAARLFETVTVLFSLRSLYFLRKIASHPVAQHVRRLEFQGGRLDYFRDRFQWESEIERRRHLAEKTPYSQGIDRYKKYNKRELAAGWKAYQGLYAEQKEIISKGIGKNEITYALLSFTNLKSIAIEKGTALECLRWRSQSYINTYGSTLLEPRGLYGWRNKTEKVGSCSLTAVLEALVHREEETKTTPLRHISALGISWHTMDYLQPLLPRLRDGLSQVIDISLKLRPRHQFFRTKANANWAYSRPERDVSSLRNFIQLFPMMKSLDLRFETTYHEMTNFLCLVHGVRWERLEDVTFGGVIFGESDMINFIKSHRERLRNLTLIDTCIRKDGSWAKLLQNIRELKIIKGFRIKDKMLTEKVLHLDSVEPFSRISCAMSEYVEGQSEIINPLMQHC